jgi:hypothetical protein
MDVGISQLASSGLNISRTKRKMVPGSDIIQSESKPSIHEKGHSHSMEKRARRVARYEQPDYETDKENIHRAGRLAPRSRTTMVLSSLVIEAPTDCSDIEFDYDEDQMSLGSQYRVRMARISDAKNAHYHFSVYEDPVVN